MLEILPGILTTIGVLCCALGLIITAQALRNIHEEIKNIHGRIDMWRDHITKMDDNKRAANVD